MHTRLKRGEAPLRMIHKGSWVALFVTWLIWVINAFDREVILRLGPAITDHFGLSPEAWGAIVSLIMISLAVLPIPGAIWSDRFGGGWKRAVFQVPVVIGYNLISAITGLKAVAHHLVLFIALRVGVSLGAGWGEPIGVSNTAEWWPKERRGFALGVHHTGYPVGALLSGIAVTAILATFGDQNWPYVFFVGLIVAIPVMLFWWWYSTKDRMEAVYQDIAAKGLTVPGGGSEHTLAKGELGRLVALCFKNPVIMLTAGTTMLTQVVYMGINVVLPLYLANVAGFSFAESAGLSVIFTLTGILGQIVWPSISDYLGRRTTLIICGLWMAVGVAAFYFATNIGMLIAIQLFFGLVANAVWPIYYAAASDAAPAEAHSTANGIITTAMFIGGGIAPVLMGWLVALGGGWTNSAGYILTFFVMAGCALLGAVLQMFTRARTSAHAQA